MPGLGRELGEMFAFMDKFEYAGGDANAVLPSEVGYLLVCSEYAS